MTSKHHRFNRNFCATPPLFLDHSQKNLAVERLCIKIENFLLSRDFLCTRQENVILRRSEGNWARKHFVSKIYILCIKIENFLLSQDFLRTRQENVILHRSEGNWVRQNFVSKIYISFPRKIRTNLLLRNTLYVDLSCIIFS